MHPIARFLILLAGMSFAVWLPSHVTLVLPRDLWAPLADWIGATASAGAVVAALVLWRLDGRRAAKAEADQRYEHRRRLVWGLRVEVEMALELLDARRASVNNVLAAVERTRQRGGTALSEKPLDPGSLAVTDAVFYRAMVPELAVLPPRLIRDIVAFYTRALEIVRLAEFAGSAVKSCEIFSDMIPRIELTARLLLLAFDKFEESGFRETADLKATKQELLRAAEISRYPLQQIASDRGLPLEELLNP